MTLVMTRLRAACALLALSAPALGAQTRMLRSPSVSAANIAFAYAQNIWVAPRAGGAARRLTSFQGATENPKISPDGKWVAFSAEYGGNVDVYVVSIDGGEPKRLTWNSAPDMVQGWTPDGKSVLFASTRETNGPTPAPKILHGSRGRRRGSAAADEPRVPGKDLARRDEGRLSHEQLVGRGAAQLPRRTEPPDLDRGPQDARRRVAAVEGLEGHGSGLGGRRRLFHLRSRRRGERLVVREQDEEARAGHRLLGLRREDARRGRRRAGVRAGGLRPRARPEDRETSRGEHHRQRRLPLDDAAVEGRVGTDREHGPLAHRQACAGRGARRDLHDSRRQGRRAQPHELERQRRARSGVVARRQAHLVLQRPVRRVPPVYRGAGRPHAAARDRAAEPQALLHAGLVARRQEDPVSRHRPETVGARRRVGTGQGRGRRPVDGAGPHDEPGLESGLQVDRVREAPELAVQGDRRLQRRDRADAAGD